MPDKVESLLCKLHRVWIAEAQMLGNLMVRYCFQRLTMDNMKFRELLTSVKATSS